MSQHQRLLAACKTLGIGPWVPGMRGPIGQICVGVVKSGRPFFYDDQEDCAADWLEPEHDLSHDPTLDLLEGVLRRAAHAVVTGSLATLQYDIILIAEDGGAAVRIKGMERAEAIVRAFEALAEHKRRGEK